MKNKQTNQNKLFISCSCSTEKLRKVKIFLCSLSMQELGLTSLCQAWQGVFQSTFLSISHKNGWNNFVKNLRLNFLSYLWVTLCKHFTGNDAALLLCPGFPVWVCSAWILCTIGIWAARRHFPAIGKLQHISHHGLTASSEVIISIAIIVSTKPTDMALHQDKQTKW